MSSSSTIDSKVDEIIATVFMLDESEFDDETEFGPDGFDAESLDVVEMAEILAEDVGVEIPDEDLEDLETVGEVKEYASQRLD